LFFYREDLKKGFEECQRASSDLCIDCTAYAGNDAGGVCLSIGEKVRAKDRCRIDGQLSLPFPVSS